MSDLSYAELMRLIDDFDLEGYLQEHGFRQLNAHHGDEWIGPCPGCGKEKCAVDADKRAFHCWVCQEYEDRWDDHEKRFRRRPVRGAGGLIGLIEWLDEIDTADAIQLIYQETAGGDLRELAAPKQLKQVLESGLATEVAPPENWRSIESPLPYMLKRGITMDDVRMFGLFWCSGGRYDNRLVFPVWEGGRLLYWQARAMWEKSDLLPGSKFIKSLNPPSTPGAVVSSDVLFNLDTARLYPRVAVTEGPIDAIHAGPSAVCTFGKQISNAQVQRLLQANVCAIDLMWDGPTPSEPLGAQPEMVKAAPWLSTFFDVKLIFLPQDDPGSYSRDHLDWFRAQGVPAQFLSPLAVLDD